MKIFIPKDYMGIDDDDMLIGDGNLGNTISLSAIK
jgi:hypothetical protein